VQVAIRDFSEAELATVRAARSRIAVFFDGDLADHEHGGGAFLELARRIAGKLTRDVYVSFDIDGLDPVLAPNTGTPVPGGLSFRQATALLAEVVRSGRRIVGFDLCEVAPDPGGREWDANVGARVLYKLCGFAIRSNAEGGRDSRRTRSPRG
jgi:agmatinase